jgi:hypothetical protein
MSDRIVVHASDDDGNDIEIEFPTRWEVCDDCGGEGSHIHESMRILTCAGTEDWDHEDWDNFRSGVYDVTCDTCGGRLVVRVVDDLAACRREQEAELRAEHFAACRFMGVDPWRA